MSLIAASRVLAYYCHNRRVTILISVQCALWRMLHVAQIMTDVPSA